jgi:CRP/FNR family transcriptional regulator, cyclic AMP receptor protein
MTMQDAAVLGAQQFLRGMREDHIAALAAASSHVTIPAGSRLFDEGGTADRFWLIDAGRIMVDVMVPGNGRLIIETLGRGDILGLSWLTPPHQWRFGAVTRQPTEAFEFDARAVRTACDADPVLGYELGRRLSAVLVRRLQATRARLVDASTWAQSGEGEDLIGLTAARR